MVSDNNIDNWDLDGEVEVEPYDAVFKDIENSYFLIGGWPRPKGLRQYSKDALVLRTTDNTSQVAINKQGVIKLSAATQLDLNAPIVTLNGTPFTSMNPIFTSPVFGTATPVTPGEPEIAVPVKRP